MDIGTTISMKNQMSTPVMEMTRSIQHLIDRFDDMQKVADKALPTAEYVKARLEMDNIRASVYAAADNIRDAAMESDRFTESLIDSRKEADSLEDSLGKIGKMIAGGIAIKIGSDLLQDGFDEFRNRRNADIQLDVVLKNIGADDRAFDSLKKKAEAVQLKTNYTSGAMTAGAAELSTYIKNTQALEHMMGTLSNYAAGMSGGVAVNQQQMVEYATQLGKALDGTYDGLKKKGFDLTEQQKYIIENGTDMQRALVLDDVISESWAGLAERMVDPVTQAQNAIADLGATVGESLAGPVEVAANLLNDLVSGIADNWDTLKWPIMGVAGAIGIYGISVGVAKAADIAHKGVLMWKGAFNVLQTKQVNDNTIAQNQNTTAVFANATGEMANTGAKVIQTGATKIATVAQLALNRAMLAMPFVGIVGGIVSLAGSLFGLGKEQEKVIDQQDEMNKMMEDFEEKQKKINIEESMGKKISDSEIFINSKKALLYWTDLQEKMNLPIEQKTPDIINQMNWELGEMANHIPNLDRATLSFDNMYTSVLGVVGGMDALIQKYSEFAITSARMDHYNEKIKKSVAEEEDLKELLEKEGPTKLSTVKLVDWEWIPPKTVSLDLNGRNSMFDTPGSILNTPGSILNTPGSNIGSKDISYTIPGRMEQVVKEKTVPVHNQEYFNLQNQITEKQEEQERFVKLMADIGAGNSTLEDLFGKTKEIKNSLDISKEDLKYLRDIAEREAVNRFTTAEIVIDMSGMTNQIDSSMDIDGVVDSFKVGMLETMSAAAEAGGYK